MESREEVTDAVTRGGRLLLLVLRTRGSESTVFSDGASVRLSSSVRRLHVSLDTCSPSACELASSDRASEGLLIRMKSSDVFADGFLPSTGDLASSDRTTEHFPQVNR